MTDEPVGGSRAALERARAYVEAQEAAIVIARQAGDEQAVKVHEALIRDANAVTAMVIRQMVAVGDWSPP